MKRRRKKPPITYRTVTNPGIPVVINEQDDGSLIIDVDENLRGRERAKKIWEVLGPYLEGDVGLLPVPLLLAHWAATADRWIHDHQWAASATAATAAAAVGAAALGVLSDAGNKPAPDAYRPSPAVTLTLARSATRSYPPGPPSTRAARPARRTTPPAHPTQTPTPGRQATAAQDQPASTWRPQPSRTAQPRPSRTVEAGPRQSPAKRSKKPHKKTPPPLAAVEAADEGPPYGRGRTERGRPFRTPTVERPGNHGRQPPGQDQQPGPPHLAAGCGRLVHVGVGDLLDVCLL